MSRTFQCFGRVGAVEKILPRRYDRVCDILLQGGSAAWLIKSDGLDGPRLRLPFFRDAADVMLFVGLAEAGRAAARDPVPQCSGGRCHSD